MVEEDPGVPDLELLRSGLRILALRALGDPHAADDVVQETMARVLAALAKGTRPGHLGAFARGVARHVIADLQRGWRRTPDELPPDGAGIPSPNPDALDALVTAEEHARLADALDHLSPADRELLRLVYFEGLAPGELAARLGEPSERIRKRKQRALERLRRAFRGLDPDLSRSAGEDDPEDEPDVRDRGERRRPDL